MGEHAHEPRKDLHLGMLSYALFTIAATMFSVAVLLVEPIRSRTVPYTGWMGLLPYSFTLFFAALSLYYRIPQAEKAILSMLKCIVAIGVFDTLYQGSSWLFGARNFDNPYLTYSHWRPMVTILLPFLWLCVLARACKPCDPALSNADATKRPDRGRSPVSQDPSHNT